MMNVRPRLRIMKFLVVCRRELRSYFSSYIAYILLAVFLLLSGYFFYSDLIFFVLFGGYILPTGLWQYVFLDMRLCALLVLPLLTMRLFAEEFKLGLLWALYIEDDTLRPILLSDANSRQPRGAL